MEGEGEGRVVDVGASVGNARKLGTADGTAAVDGEGGPTTGTRVGVLVNGSGVGLRETGAGILDGLAVTAILVCIDGAFVKFGLTDGAGDGLFVEVGVAVGNGYVGQLEGAGEGRLVIVGAVVGRGNVGFRDGAGECRLVVVGVVVGSSWGDGGAANGETVGTTRTVGSGANVGATGIAVEGATLGTGADVGMTATGAAFG